MFVFHYSLSGVRFIISGFAPPVGKYDPKYDNRVPGCVPYSLTQSSSE